LCDAPGDDNEYDQRWRLLLLLLLLLLLPLLLPLLCAV
jgi:hypothetical protein